MVSVEPAEQLPQVPDVQAGRFHGIEVAAASFPAGGRGVSQVRQRVLRRCGDGRAVNGAERIADIPIDHGLALGESAGVRDHRADRRCPGLADMRVAYVAVEDFGLGRIRPPPGHGDEDGALALAEIVGDRLAGLRWITEEAEYVVPKLECDAERDPVVSTSTGYRLLVPPEGGRLAACGGRAAWGAWGRAGRDRTAWCAWCAWGAWGGAA
jgi:hypothetical protein